MKSPAKLPANPIRGVLQVVLPAFLAVYVGSRARFFDHQESATLAACVAGISGLSVASYYLRLRFLWHDFSSGNAKSPFQRALELVTTLTVVVLVVVTLGLIAGNQG